MTVAEYIFDYLCKKGCRTVYMVSGSSSMWLTDALKRNDKLKAICCHHEQAAAMAADVSGRLGISMPGICLVTIGPGAMNAITGVAEAYLDSSPIIIISGQASSKLLQYEMTTGIRQHGTQSINLEQIVRPITKYFAAVLNPNDIYYHMEKAYTEALEGRRGPVWLDIPVDIQNKQISKEDTIDRVNVSVEESSVILPDDIKTVVDYMQQSKKPLILAGYGVRSDDSVQAFREFVNKYQIPVVTSRGGIDVIASDSNLFVGRPGSYGDRASHFAIQGCDLLLILGSRLSVSTVGYYPQRFACKAKKIMVDIDEKELRKQDVPVDLKIKATVKDFLKALKQNFSGLMPEHQEWLNFCRNVKNKYPTVLNEYEQVTPLNSYFFTKKLSELVADFSTIVVDTGSVCNIVSQSWELKENQRYLISGGLSCMGFWAGAIGAAEHNKPVIVLTGDGSMQMNIQELATLRYNNLPIKIFVYQNKGYLLIRHNQHNYMEDRYLGVGPDSGLETPDFVEVARAYKIKALRINCKEELEAKIKEVLVTEGPVVCEVMVEEFGKIEPRIASKVLPDGSLRAAEFDDLYPFIEEKIEV